MVQETFDLLFLAAWRLVCIHSDQLDGGSIPGLTPARDCPESARQVPVPGFETLPLEVVSNTTCILVWACFVAYGVRSKLLVRTRWANSMAFVAFQVFVAGVLQSRHAVHQEVDFLDDP